MARVLIVAVLWLGMISSAFAQALTAQSGTDDADAVRSANAASDAACKRAPSKRCVLAFAVAEADRIGNEEPTRWLFMEIARVQAEAGDAYGALATVRKIGDITNYSQIFDAILNAQVRSGDVTAILSAAARLEDNWQRASALLKVAEACSDAGRSDLAGEALKVAISNTKTAAPLAARAASAAEVADAAAAIGDIESAQQAIDLALATAKMPVTPSVRSRTLAGVAAVRAVIGEDDKAVATAGAIADEELRSSALARVAAAQARAGRFGEALSTVESIEDFAARASALTWIAHAHNATGHSTEARDAIERALSSASLIGDPEKRAWTLIQIAQLQPAPTNRREMLQVSMIAARSDVWGVEPYITAPIHDSEAFARPIDSSVTRAALAAAVQAAQQIDDVAKQNAPLFRVAELQIATGDVAGALETSEQIEDTSSVELHWSQPAAGDAERGPATGFMSSTGERDRILTRIAKAQGEAGDMAAMLDTVGKIGNPLIRVDSLKRLTNHFVSRHEPALARALVEAAVKSSEQIEKDVRRAVALIDIAEMQAAIGDASAALQTAQKIADEGRELHALRRIAWTLAATQTQAAAQAIEDAFLRTLAFTAIAGRRVAMGDPAAARDIIGAALHSSETIGESKKRAIALTLIGEVQVAVGDIQGVRQTIAAVTVAAGGVTESTDQSHVSATIADAQANAGEFAAALASVETLDDAAWRARTLVSIAKAMPN